MGPKEICTSPNECMIKPKFIPFQFHKYFTYHCSNIMIKPKFHYNIPPIQLPKKMNVDLNYYC